MHQFGSRNRALYVLLGCLNGAAVLAGDFLPAASVTYQGQLKQEGVPYTGLCDMQFELWNSATETDPNVGRLAINVFGSVAGNPPPVEVVNGLFQVELNFPEELFDGSPRWLQVVVGCPAGEGEFAELSPRQKLTAAPFATYSYQTRGLYVDGAGNVGIGTSSPGAVTTIARPAQGQAHQLELRNEGSIQAPNFDGIRFSQGPTGGTTLGSINLLYRNNGLPDLSFSLRNDPDVLFLRAGGVVGIRTTTPSTSRALTVQGVGASANWLQFRDSAGADLWHLTNEGNGLNFVESGVSANRLFLAPGGNVGIGTASPDRRLHVHNGSAGAVTGQGNAPLVVENSTSAYVNILTPATNESGVLFGNPTSNSAGGVIYNSGSTSNGLQFRTNGNVTRMVIDESGDVGIGTTTPDARLHVLGGTDAGPAGTGGYIVAGPLDGQNVAIDNNEIAARNNGALTRLAINADGGEVVVTGQPGDRVGVGTTNPQVKLDVLGDGDDDGGVAGANEVVARFRDTTATGHTAISIDANTGQDAVLYFAEGGSAAWGWRADADEPIWAEGQFELRYHRGDNNITVNQVTAGGNYTHFTMYHRGGIVPWVDAEYSLGSSGMFSGGRWKDVWAANAFIQTSDRREKKDIHDLEVGLKELLQLRPVTFQWDRKNDDGGMRFGLIAQEVDAVIPNAVEKPENPDALWGMSYATLVPVLIKAVQEQQAVIDQQARKIEELRETRRSRDQELETLRSRLDAIESAIKRETLTHP